jgi:NADPH-dependent curcumin reductase CurA
MKGTLPREVTKIVGTKLSRSFRDCTTICCEPFPAELKPQSVVVRNIFVGINASDINYTAGTYKPLQPPFDCGFEALGEVVATGSAVDSVRVGQHVVFQSFGAFASFQTVPSRILRVIPRPDRDYLPLEISGLTASIALDECARPKEGETALVTAAAGGTGTFAVQLLKKVYKCKTVIGTCSSPAKADLLRSLGCDLVVNYREESVEGFLSKSCPHGVHVVYESVGGSSFDAGLTHLAVKGRLISLGSISDYKEGTMLGEPRVSSGRSIPYFLLTRSASIHGFFLPHYPKLMGPHFEKLATMLSNGTIKSVVDNRQFRGLSSVADAIEYLYRGENVGKVIVEL